ncbi:putative trna (uracil-5-)-methyltransferase [Diaporthe ampelina]|uniref:Putative trna (Uracil-5-)-methyltransferase n=1 Tax=Diaporthe ampelina TaxID=1214573 RepID=A0A0G2FM76_9PEZI|nr:putative trna (uracil-5-)-methyltransferase [Diaporthe ampelina]
MPKKQKPAKEGSNEEVLMLDIQALIEETKEAGDGSAPETEAQPETLPEQGTEVEVEVLRLSSTGDGLARQPGFKQIYVVPFAIPGDTVKVKAYRYLPKENYTAADFISVTKPSPLRDDSRIKCKYFTRCGGCQFQMMDYADQLKHKKTIVERAFRNFSNLPPELIPAVQDTFGSPLQYGYRTKLTPHFDGPPGFQGKRRGVPKEKKALQEMPDIGFMLKGGPRRVLDIEDCPIGTDAVRRGMARERERMKAEYGTYERGATILLRENTARVAKGDPLPDPLPNDAVVVVDGDSHTDIKTCITDNNATSKEYIGDFTFTNRAGDFFQNNNSILKPFTDHIREHILPPSPPTTTTTTTSSSSSSSSGGGVSNNQKPIRYLIDAYSGSGLFTITLSTLFPGGSIGIDIAEKSIAFARRNAALNGLAEGRQCTFIAADAPRLFESVAQFDPDETAVVLDPPRKGCDESFLRQLLGFAPRRVVYVSCNVHTQARDVGVLVSGEVGGFMKGPAGEKAEGQVGENGGAEKKKKTRYEIESLRGFDFFPQTSHVEGVAILNRVDS